MSRWEPDGTRTATNFFECAAWHYAVVATCGGCGRETVFDPHALWWLFERKGWDDHLRHAGRRFRCETCAAAATLTLARHRRPTVLLPLPDERDWKRAVSRFRS